MEPTQIIILAGAGLAALAMLCGAALRGWHGWLTLKARELDLAQHRRSADAPGMTGRIELADLRERVRQLEAIAAGVDL